MSDGELRGITSSTGLDPGFALPDGVTQWWIRVGNDGTRQLWYFENGQPVVKELEP